LAEIYAAGASGLPVAARRISSAWLTITGWPSPGDGHLDLLELEAPVAERAVVVHAAPRSVPAGFHEPAHPLCLRRECVDHVLV